MLITTSFRANEQTIETAKALAKDLHGEYIERRKQSVKQLAIKRGMYWLLGKNDLNGISQMVKSSFSIQAQRCLG